MTDFSSYRQSSNKKKQQKIAIDMNVEIVFFFFLFLFLSMSSSNIIKLSSNKFDSGGQCHLKRLLEFFCNGRPQEDTK